MVEFIAGLWIGFLVGILAGGFWMFNLKERKDARSFMLLNNKK